MLKKFSKLLLLVLLIFVVSSSTFICLADEAGKAENTVTTSETNEETTTDETTSTEEIYSGDLYLFDNDIVMDKLVDGNVFIFGNNVEITGQINGNLFVFADNLNFNGCIIRYSIFACANSVYYNGGCYNDFYVATNKLEMTYDSYVARDVKAVSSNVICKGAVGRDMDLLCNTIDLGEGADIPLIYGNFRYTANNEVTIPEGALAGSGSATYTKPSELNTSSVTDILIGFATCIITALAICFIIKKVTPKFAEKISKEKFTAIGLLKAFGIGIASIFAVSILFMILLITSVGAKLAFILVLLFATLCLVAVPTLAISITNALKPKLKIEKTSMFCLILSLVSIVLYGITFIPFIGGLLGFIISVTAIGFVINTFLPHKELTDEEKAVIEEAKQQAKEDKEKRKQEKLKEKVAKKQQKLEAQKDNKEDKNL